MWWNNFFERNIMTYLVSYIFQPDPKYGRCHHRTLRLTSAGKPDSRQQRSQSWYVLVALRLVFPVWYARCKFYCLPTKITDEIYIDLSLDKSKDFTKKKKEKKEEKITFQNFCLFQWKLHPQFRILLGGIVWYCIPSTTRFRH